MEGKFIKKCSDDICSTESCLEKVMGAKYRNSSGGVVFSVRSGLIIKLSGSTRCRCGVWSARRCCNSIKKIYKKT